MVNQNQNYLVRNAVAKDCGELRLLIGQIISGAEVYSAHARETEIRKLQARMDDLIEADETRVLVAANHEEIVGFAILEIDGGVCWIAWFGVLREKRKLGIARLILEEIFGNCVASKCHKVWCDTRDNNLRAIDILTAANFVSICQIRNHWYGHDYILWERPVNV